MNVNEGGDLILPTVAQQLKKVCIDHSVKDVDLVLDIYLVCSHKGTQFIPDEELMQDIERTDPSYWRHRMDISKRKQFLEKMSESNYVQALIKLNDPMKAVLTFVDHLRKALEAQALSASKCTAIDHSSGAIGGMRATGSALDEVEKAIVNHGMDFDLIIQGMTTVADACDSDECAAFMEGCGVGSYFNATTAPARALAAAVVQKGTSLPTHLPLLYDQFTKITEKLGIAKMKEVDTDKDAKRKKREQMDDHAQVTSVDPAEVVHETFDARMAHKQLDVAHNKEEEEGLSYLFVLLDVSGSMMSADLGGRVCRAFGANVITLSLLQFAMKSKYKVYVVPFTGHVNTHGVQVATDRESALKAMRWLGTQDYNGSSTDIQEAVLWAYRQVVQDPTYKKCDVVLITDGCSPISQALMSMKPRDTKLRTLLVTGGEGHGSHSSRLKDASDTFTQIDWDNNKAEFTIGNTLRGINAPISTTEEY